jgi:tetratricopeptide (TPR) repeat protein
MTRRDVLSTVLLVPAAGITLRGRQASDGSAFARGVTLLHGFDYDGARTAFREARAADSGRVMATWGEAMTHHRPLWGETDLDSGQAALAQLAPTPEARLALAANDRERDWLRTAEALFAPLEKLERERQYTARLAQLSERYPDDLDARAFHALALLSAGYPTRDLVMAMKAAALLEGVARRDPRHVGAPHYLIHAYDDAAHAPLGVHHAESFAGLGPATAYANHVISRPFLAVGAWDKATDANRRALAAPAPPTGGGAVHDQARLWQLYSLLQEGRHAEAKTLLAAVETAAGTGDDLPSRAAVARARAMWLIETRRWPDAKLAPTPEGLAADATAAELLAVGMAAFRSGNRAAGSDALQRMAALVGDGDRPLRSVTTARPPTSARPGVNRPGVTPIPTPRPGLPVPWGAPAEAAPPTQGLERRLAAVMAQQLEAVLIFSEGRRDEAIVLARQAAAVADGLEGLAGPPMPVKPGHELVGDFLMDVRRPGEAILAYEAALRRHPRRPLSLLGLARAATATKALQKAQAALVELRAVWHKADKTLPEWREVMGTATPPS